MRILVEQHPYPYERVRDDLWDGVSADPDGTVTFDCVGYFFNERSGHCTMILPRVLLEDVDVPGAGKEERVFAAPPDARSADNPASYGFRPEDIVDPEEKVGGKYRLGREQRAFVREFAVWVYRAVDRYWKELCKEAEGDEDRERGRRKRNTVLRKFVPVMGRGALRASHTLLDVILALLDFRKENESFFLTVLRERRSGLSRINWTKTVSRSPMVWSGGAPMYPNPVNRHREINLDEELFVVFHSILSYLKREYGFDPLPNPGFAELPPAIFAHYLDGYGSTRLRQIKGKYFSDLALKMWDLCYAFFEHRHEIRIQSRRQEYLLAKSFQIVFEAMIDDLIGERNVPDGLKEQEDGKRVDHLYRYYGLSVADGDEKAENEVWYIGDSKYYKRRTDIGKESAYKQFTYARNLVQWNLDLFLDEAPEGALVHGGERKLRNDETEGYAIVPNFFISARIDDDLRYDHPEITATGKETKDFFARQFENRLYDRDTLLVAHYDVNFLYVLALYARNRAPAKAAWREAVRKEFRRRIREMLLKRFDFYVMTPKADTDPPRFFEEHFRDLVGRVYDPYGERPDGFRYYSLALRRKDEERHRDWTAENDRVKDLLAQGFNISRDPLADLGTKPETVVSGERRNPLLVMSSYNFERAAKELGAGSYSAYFPTKSIAAMKQAGVFPLEARIGGIKANPESVHTVFLFESGMNNVLKAALQVVYLDEVPSYSEACSYTADGIDCSKLAHVPTGGSGPHWLWRIEKWVDMPPP